MHCAETPLCRDRTPFSGTVAYMGGVPALLSEFVWSWTQMLAFNGEAFGPGAVHYDRSAASYHSSARNELAGRMRGDWLLQLDTDHQFDPDLAWRLVNTMREYKLDVVCGFYQYKTPPHAPILYKYLPPLSEGGEPVARPVTGWSDVSPLIRVDATGGGCLLVRRRVFDRIRGELREEPFDVRHPWSEDHSFFLRLKKLNIPVWCDTRVQCNHLTTRKILPKDFMRDMLGGGRVEHEFEAAGVAS